MSLSVATPASAQGMSRFGSRRRRTILLSVYLLGFALIALLVADGYSYYRTSYLERPHHQDYRQLRPAGSRGMMYGIIGTTMMALMLAYTLRKRTRFLERKISLRSLLDFHIAMGVFAPLFIVLHTSFKVQGLVAIAFWSMVAVALSGYFGRYLYQQIPRNIEDRELTLREIEQTAGELASDLKQEGHLDDAILERITKAFDKSYALSGRNIFWLILSMILKDLRRPWINARLRRRLSKSCDLPKERLDVLFVLASHRALLNRRIVVLARVQRLFHYWHVIHKPFAMIMYIIMGVHIGIAVWTGYAWF